MVAGLDDVRWPGWSTLTAMEHAVWATWEDCASLLPDGIRGHILRSSKIVLIDSAQGEGAIEATLADGRRLDVEGAADASGLQRVARRHAVVLRVRDDEILKTVMRVPRRAIQNLDAVVATNISVWTPFTADALYFKACALEGGSTAGDDGLKPTCDVELRCVPKAVLERCFLTLDSRSIVVDEVWLGRDGAFSCDLGSKKSRKAKRRQRAILLLVGLTILQLYVSSSLYRLHQDREIAALQIGIDRIRQAVHAQTVRLQTENETARTLGAVRARAIGQDSVAYALRSLAGVLPAGASYRELSMSHAGGGSLTIVSKERIDPVTLVAATGLLTVTEVNETSGAQEAEHSYSVAFRPVRPVADFD